MLVYEKWIFQKNNHHLPKGNGGCFPYEQIMHWNPINIFGIQILITMIKIYFKTSKGFFEFQSFAFCYPLDIPKIAAPYSSIFTLRM